MLHVGRDHFVERERASDIHVHYEKLLRVAAQNLVPEMI